MSGLAIGQVSSPDVTAGVTLAILALVAVAIVRDRSARESVQKLPEALTRVEGGLANVERAIAALDSPLPYEVIDQVQTWNLEANGDALITKTQKVRFIRQARVIEQRFWGTGEEGRFDQWIVFSTKTLKLSVATFKSPVELLRIVNLGRLVRQGAILQFLQEREVRGQYQLADEDVSVTIDVPCQRAVFEILWPLDKEPGEVTLDGPGPGDYADLTGDLTLSPAGQKRLRKEFRDLQIGTKVAIHWKW